MKLVLSLGGSVLAPRDPERVGAYAAVIENLVAAGHTVGAVVGGGTVAREYIHTARELGANEIELDQLGVDTTRLNARLLIAALSERAATRPAHDYETAGAALRRGEIAVMGGIAPGQTTDAVSAALAEYAGADLLVYATSVPGVFDADPAEDDGAHRYGELSATELVDVIADIEMTAGASAPVDLLAAKIIERSGVRTVVLDGTDPNRVAEVVESGSHDGTDIVPATADEPTYWAMDD
ncbi:UMP kinase [Halobacteriales archaeon QH_9_66_26]|nr:MAG: UMP kinase [Halobacteriales archaeon QH_9_66_26]